MLTKSLLVIAIVLVALFGGASGCVAVYMLRQETPRPGPWSPVLTSSAFTHNGPIPLRYTCAGDNLSPPLSWAGAPLSAKSFVLIMEGPEASDPSASRWRWAHWILYNIPPQTQSLAAGQSNGELPRGTLRGRNDWGKTDYGGPCQPIGPGAYTFRLYALDRVLPDLHEPTMATLGAAITGHSVGVIQLIGTYHKGQPE